MEAKYNDKNYVNSLVKGYLCMSQKGTVYFDEETAVLAIVKHFHNEGNIEMALQVVSDGLCQFTYSAELYACKASLLIEQEQEEAALEYLEQALNLAPNEPRILLLKAEVLSNSEAFEEALNILDFLKTYTNKQELEHVFLLEAFIYENLDEYNYMFDSLASALKINPQNSEALGRIWYATELAQRHEDSVTLHKYILDEEDAFLSQAWHNLGHAYAGLDNLEAAMDAYDYAVVTNENSEYAYRDYALTCLQTKRFAKALELYLEIDERFGGDADVYSKIGICYMCLENYMTAATWLARALKEDSKNDEAHFRMGECLMIQGAYPSAIDAFNKAISIAGQLEEYHLALAISYEKSGDLANAEVAYYRLTEVAPEKTEHWLCHVNFLRHKHDTEGALEMLDEAEMNISINANLLYSRVICLFELGRRNEALLFLQQALMEDYALHGVLFEELPYLENDRDVLALIRSLS